jgi:transposase InsO family protein
MRQECRTREPLSCVTAPLNLDTAILKRAGVSLSTWFLSLWSTVALRWHAVSAGGTLCLARRPRHIRSDSGPEFAVKAVRHWPAQVGVQTLFITPGSSWEKGYIERFNGRLRDELLDRELFDTPWEAKVLVERWRQTYNRIPPHSALGYQPPAPETIVPQLVGPLMLGPN